MIKLYKISHKQTTLLLVFMIVIILLGIVGVGFMVKQLSLKVITWGFMISFGTYAVRRTYLDYSSELILSGTGIKSKRNNEVIQLVWKDIVNLEYRGIKGIPIFDMLIINVNTGEKIYIDYTFIDYLNVWSDVIEMCKKNNSQICIDLRLFKKIEK